MPPVMSARFDSVDSGQKTMLEKQEIKKYQKELKDARNAKYSAKKKEIEQKRNVLIDRLRDEIKKLKNEKKELVANNYEVEDDDKIDMWQREIHQLQTDKALLEESR